MYIKFSTIFLTNTDRFGHKIIIIIFASGVLTSA